MFDVPAGIWIYALGALVGLALTDAPLVHRLGLALLWPIGPAALLMTLAVLVVASFIAFPIIGALGLAAIAAWWWIAGA
ncbi:MAG TPA: hypothetical protein VIX63_02000 [Vicinamibacterales bacterium]